MTTEVELASALSRATPDTPDQMSKLHERLVKAAQAEGILDVSYRTLDTPVGTLLLAATEVGLVRVAYSSEGHDAVLQDLAERISASRIQPYSSQLRSVASGAKASPRLFSAAVAADCLFFDAGQKP